jgi:hypothetical protein
MRALWHPHGVQLDVDRSIDDTPPVSRNVGCPHRTTARGLASALWTTAAVALVSACGAHAAVQREPRREPPARSVSARASASPSESAPCRWVLAAGPFPYETGSTTLSPERLDDLSDLAAELTALDASLVRVSATHDCCTEQRSIVVPRSDRILWLLYDGGFRHRDRLTSTAMGCVPRSPPCDCSSGSDRRGTVAIHRLECPPGAVP